MRFVQGLSLSYVEYERQTLGMVADGKLTAWEASYGIRLHAPKGAVVITLFTKVEYEKVEPPQPHPECEAHHISYSDYPEKWLTRVTTEAFPNVEPEHREAVASLGIKNRVVRIPLVQRPVVEFER